MPPNPTPPPAAFPELPERIDWVPSGFIHRPSLMLVTDRFPDTPFHYFMATVLDRYNTHAALLAEREALREALESARSFMRSVRPGGPVLTSDVEVFRKVDTALTRKEPARD